MATMKSTMPIRKTSGASMKPRVTSFAASDDTPAWTVSRTMWVTSTAA